MIERHRIVVASERYVGCAMIGDEAVD